MWKNIKLRTLMIVIFILFSVVFYLGGSNPNFDLHDFCLGLCTVILGIVIALTIIDKYASEKTKWKETRRETRQHQDAAK